MSSSVAIGVASAVLNSSLAEELKAKGCDPFEIMMEVAMDRSDPELSFAAAKELAKYIRPTLKAVDIRVAGQVQKTFAVVKFSDVDPKKAAELAKGISPEKLLKAVLPNAAVVDHLRREMEAPAIEGTATVVTAAAIEEEVQATVNEDDTTADELPRNARPLRVINP